MVTKWIESSHFDVEENLRATEQSDLKAWKLE